MTILEYGGFEPDERAWDDAEPWTEDDEDAWLQIDLFELGYYDEPKPEPPDCPHEHAYEATGHPDYSGRCRVYAVCEDCGEELAQTGWDFV